MRLGISVWDLQPQNLAWVLMRQSAHFERLPMLGEEISILTYPAGFDRVFTFRDYQVFDAQQRCIIQAASTWLLMDTQARKMTRIPDFITALSPAIPAPEKCLPRCGFTLYPLETFDRTQLSKVGWYDLDFNAHVNNVQYVKWMLETIPTDTLKDKHLQTLEIQFRAECRLGDEVQSASHAIESTMYKHQLTLNGSQKELALAKTTWT
ncbi:MAG: acyl-ACP thioesterase [Saprospiraceae bacterium]|nr:acyl-ACP thioesterase [Saprospiraceae bacterium]